MKKLLKVLTVIGFSALAAAPVVACEKTSDDKTSNQNNSSNQNNNSR
ncbi:hypothetical protein V2P57_02030 [Mycoplasma mycoides subsp. mycoides]|uniref:Spiralin family protein n=1 Tax=Mycoplasma mycoides subsp. mycoides TaxID=2103 RepID=A0AAE2JT14_MYCMY|nr:hypothetical protein [Mycoplasma mycoides]AMK56723.1 hypothetical protein MSCT144_08290 [Mycoplasma mycoides subsp. mycoides]KJQ45722.1 spiralin family protein [Mycoplasma mycoides subsp. mycoides]KJQ47309.1 spiralin family protein [Mycoplasma mycoides subsp. mycoides]